MQYLELHNYRCFEHLELSFKSKVNLLIGDNASGKTTIIKAAGSVLNAFFAGFSDEHTRFSGLSKEDFTTIATPTGLANEKPIQVNFRLLDREASLQLHSVKGRTLQKPLAPIANLGKEWYDKLFNEEQKQVQALPLFAAFYAADIRAVRKKAIKPFKQYAQKPSFGYYECLQGDDFLPYWTKRLLVLHEAEKGALEVNGVYDAILQALGPEGCGIISNMHIRHNQGKVYYYSPDGREVETERLSDGYRRLVGMVMDLAFRCMMLNQGIYGLVACRETEGTVLIDEIDLHLHPTLQTKVIKGLQRAFPRLQLIATTHAPMVMTGIPMDSDHKIYHLHFSPQKGYSAREVQLYGLDASTIIEAALGVTPRSKQVDERLSVLFSLIDGDDYAAASRKLEEMRQEFGDRLPELAKAEAMLNFLTEDNGHHP
jgi:predicted ATP-binding protein involved in virulence